MMAVFVADVRAIYAAPGQVPSNQRINQRNSDFEEASRAADGRLRYTPNPPTDEWMDLFDIGTPNGNRYGFGWRGRQWLQLRGDGDAVGRVIADRLRTRALSWDSYVTVYETFRDVDGSDRTGEVVFEERWV
jgi:hypothetical protein